MPFVLKDFSAVSLPDGILVVGGTSISPGDTVEHRVNSCYRLSMNQTGGGRVAKMADLPLDLKTQFSVVATPSFDSVYLLSVQASLRYITEQNKWVFDTNLTP